MSPLAGRGGEAGAGGGAGLDAVDAEGAPVAARGVPGHQEPARPGHQAVGLHAAPARRPAVVAVVEAQQVVVAQAPASVVRTAGSTAGTGRSQGTGTVAACRACTRPPEAGGEHLLQLGRARWEASSIPRTAPPAAGRSPPPPPLLRRPAAAGAGWPPPPGGSPTAPWWRAPGSPGRASAPRRCAPCGWSPPGAPASSGPVESGRAWSSERRRRSGGRLQHPPTMPAHQEEDIPLRTTSSAAGSRPASCSAPARRWCR